MDREEMAAQLLPAQPGQASDRVGDDHRVHPAASTREKATILLRSPDRNRLRIRVRAVIEVLLPVDRLRELLAWLAPQNTPTSAAPGESGPGGERAGASGGGGLVGDVAARGEGMSASSVVLPARSYRGHHPVPGRDLAAGELRRRPRSPCPLLRPRGGLLSGASGTGKSTWMEAYLALPMPSDTALVRGPPTMVAHGRARGADQRNLLTSLQGTTESTRQPAACVRRCCAAVTGPPRGHRP